MAKLSQVLRTNSSIRWYSLSANKTVLAGDGLIITNTLTVTLPIQPAVGDVIQLILLNSSEVTLNRNSKLIDGTTNNLVINAPSLIHTLIFAGATVGWIYSNGESSGIPPLAQDIAGSPGAKQYYGTNELAAKGFWTLPEIDKTKIPLSSIRDINAIVTSVATL